MCVVICPYCSNYIVIDEINCGIFRHAYYKTTMHQIPPHTSKKEIDILIKGLKRVIEIFKY